MRRFGHWIDVCDRGGVHATRSPCGASSTQAQEARSCFLKNSLPSRSRCNLASVLQGHRDAWRLGNRRGRRELLYRS